MHTITIPSTDLVNRNIRVCARVHMVLFEVTLALTSRPNLWLHSLRSLTRIR